MFFNSQTEINNKKLIFDQTYKNSFQKDQIDNNDKYFYYRALSKIKYKYNKRDQRDIVENVFRPDLIPKKISVISRVRPSTGNFSYNVEKINNKMFKIQRNHSISNYQNRNTSNTFKTRPDANTISLQGDTLQISKEDFRSKIEQIITKHNTIHRNYKSKKKQILKEQFAFNDYYKNLKIGKKLLTSFKK